MMIYGIFDFTWWYLESNSSDSKLRTHVAMIVFTSLGLMFHVVVNIECLLISACLLPFWAICQFYEDDRYHPRATSKLNCKRTMLWNLCVCNMFKPDKLTCLTQTKNIVSEIRNQWIIWRRKRDVHWFAEDLCLDKQQECCSLVSSESSSVTAKVHTTQCLIHHLYI